jgi:hypothetical protein
VRKESMVQFRSGLGAHYMILVSPIIVTLSIAVVRVDRHIPQSQTI